jgi:hypothetical protein
MSDFIASASAIIAYDPIQDVFSHPLTTNWDDDHPVSVRAMRTYISYIVRCIRNCNSAQDLDKLREWDDELVLMQIRANQAPPLPQNATLLDEYRYRQFNKYRPIGSAVLFKGQMRLKFQSDVNEIVKKWNRRFIAVRDRRIELRDFIEMGKPYVDTPPNASSTTQSMGRYCCEAEINDIANNLFRQAGRYSEAYKWFYDPAIGEKERAQNIDKLNAVTHHVRVNLVDGAKALLLGQARTVNDDRDGPIAMAVQSKPNENGCFGIHGDVLVYFNRLVVSVSFAKKGSNDFKPLTLEDGARSNLQ